MENKKIIVGIAIIILVISVILVAAKFISLDKRESAPKSQTGMSNSGSDGQQLQNDQSQQKNEVLPPLVTIEGTVVSLENDNLLALKESNGMRNIVVSQTTYVYEMEKSLPSTKKISDVKPGMAVVIQLKPDTQVQEASSIFIKK